MNTRTRITIDVDLFQEAQGYAAAGNRTFSELTSTALEHYMHRYPKREKEVDSDRLTKLENRVDQLLGIKRKP